MGHEVTRLKKIVVSSVFFLSLPLLNGQAVVLTGLTATPEPLISFIQPIVDTTFLSYSQRLNLVKLYIDANLGNAALATLKPLMHGTKHYQVMLLAAQSYAELERPIESLTYYELAHSLAKSDQELDISARGVTKLQNWINASNPSSLAPIYATYSAYYQCIQLLQQYINDNQGQAALNKIKSIGSDMVSYDIYLLTAQAYAESEDPRRALHYYQLARSIAKSNRQIERSKIGIHKMQRWLFANKKKPVARQYTPEELACKGIKVHGKDQYSCVKRIQLARQFLSLNKGQRAIKILAPC